MLLRKTREHFFSCAAIVLILPAVLLVPTVSAKDNTALQESVSAWPNNLPVYDHIVIVIEENKNYDQIIGSDNAPYINDTLKAEGANFTRMFAEEHHSQGNYFWLFSGDNYNIGFDDVIPNSKNNSAYPFSRNNLGQQLITHKFSFKGYSEDLPEIGSEKELSGKYARKHVPWVSFSNVPNGQTVSTSSNLRFKDFPADYSQLPTVSIIVPNLDNDMHDGSISDSITHGDTWLEQNLDDYYQWAKTHNSLLIVTFDEDSNGPGGLTAPGSGKLAEQNKIFTVFAGAHIQPGDYSEGKGITHVNILRTLEAMYGLEKSGMQQKNALAADITDSSVITDVFIPVRRQ